MDVEEKLCVCRVKLCEEEWRFFRTVINGLIKDWEHGSA